MKQSGFGSKRTPEENHPFRSSFLLQTIFWVPYQHPLNNAQLGPNDLPADLTRGESHLLLSKLLFQSFLRPSGRWSVRTETLQRGILANEHGLAKKTVYKRTHLWRYFDAIMLSPGLDLSGWYVDHSFRLCLSHPFQNDPAGSDVDGLDRQAPWDLALVPADRPGTSPAQNWDISMRSTSISQKHVCLLGWFGSWHLKTSKNEPLGGSGSWSLLLASDSS